MKKTLISLVLLGLVASPIWAYSRYQAAVPLANPASGGSGVLGESSQQPQIQFNVNVPAVFNKDIVAPNVVYSVNGQTGAISIDNSLAAGTGITVTDRTIGLTLQAGSGISVEGNKITNSGITSLSAGTGISIDGNKITNTYSFTPDYTQSGWKRVGTVVSLATLTDSVEVGALTAESLVVNGITVLDGNVTIGNGVSILPNTDLGSDLGSSSFRFNNLWVANINSNSSQSFSGQTTFSYPPTSSAITQASVLINPTTSATDGQLLGLGIAGYQRALIDEDGDLTLGYLDATSAPVSDYPLNIYGHSGIRVSFVDTSGNGYFAGNVGVGTTNTAAKLDINVTLSPTLTTGLKIVAANDATYTANASRYGLYVDNQSDDCCSQYGIYSKSKGNNTSSNYIYGLYGEGGENGFAGNAFGVYGKGVAGSNRVSHGVAGEATSNGASTVIGGKFIVSGAATTAANTIALLANLNYSNADADARILDLRNNDSTLMLVQASGNVGIGTTSPTHSLQVGGVTGTSTQTFSLTGGGYGRIYGSSNKLTITTFDETHNIMRNGTGGFYVYNGATGINTGFSISNAGNVGIGTTNPLALLHVNGESRTTSLTFNGNTSNMLTEGWGVISKLADNIGSHAFRVRDSSNNERLTVLSSGNVGIGTTSPQGKLHVYASNGEGIYVGNSPSGNYAADYTSGIYFDTANRLNAKILAKTISGGGGELEFFTTTDGTAMSQNMTIDKSGNVGIGTTSPSSRLHLVADNAYIILDRTGNDPAIVMKNSGTALGQLRATAGASNIMGITDAGGNSYYFSVNTSSGNVGIGTTNPLAKLETIGNIYSNNTKSDTVFGGNPGLHVANFIGSNGYWALRTDTSNRFNIDVYNSGTAVSALTVNQSGNVGIGTTSPSQKLSVEGNLYIGSGGVISSRTDAGYGLTLGSNTSLTTTGHLSFSTLTPGSITMTSGGSGAINLNSTTGNILLNTSGNVGIGTTSPRDKLDVIGNIVINDNTYLAGYNGSTRQGYLQMHSSSTNLIAEQTAGLQLLTTSGIVTIDPNTTGAGTINLGQSGDSDSVVVNSLTTGTVYSNAGVLTNTDPSDINLKDNILNLPDGTLDKVLGLQPVSFNWKSTGDGALGFIAQDVANIFPELVSNNSDGTLGLYTTQFIPVLAKAIQEQQLQIDEITLATGSAVITNSEWNFFTNLLTELKETIASIGQKLTDLTTRVTKLEEPKDKLCVGEAGSETCLTQEQIIELTKLLPSPTASSSASPAPSLEPSPVATESAEGTN